MNEPNGHKVKLSVRDIVAWLVLFAAILGGWYDTRGQMALLRQELAIRVKEAEKEHARMWKSIDDANAGERPQPRR